MGKTDKISCKEELTALRDSLEILGGKWKLQIMRYLSNRPNEENNFKKIKQGVPGISAKMLSKELKDLEINLLINRTVRDTKPLTVAYSITDYGNSVVPVTCILVNWGMEHREKIIKNYN